MSRMKQVIADKDISIVVQGPIIYEAAFGITSNVTQLICLRLKKLFPESELILSTWEGEKIEGIPHDLVIYNKDPGATWFNYDDPHLLNNCNRLIVSTLAGIKSSTRKYVLKLRSDIFMVSKNFLKFFGKFPEFNREYKFVKDRIICFSLNTLYGHKTSMFTMYRPFHVSDWAYFGHKDDLLNLYDIPLTSEPEFSQWFLNRCKPFYDIEPWRLWKMPPEQYITLCFLKKFTPINLEHTADASNNNMALSDKLLTNNFLILDQTQFFLISLKYLYFAFSSFQGYEWYIFHSDWLRNYCSLMQLTKFTKIKFKFIIVYRKLSITISNKVLRLLNYKNHFVLKSCAYFIKKSAIKDDND